MENSELQEVVYNGEERRQLSKENKETIITLKSVGLSFGKIVKKKKKIQVSASTGSYMIKRHLETGGNFDRKRSDRPKATD